MTQQTKARLEKAEATLLLLIRTYLQRVSSRLSAVELVDLTKAAIALLASEKIDSQVIGSNLSLPERKHLLSIALQTFATRLSQPIPALSDRIPKRIAHLVARLARYQNIMRTNGVKAVFVTLAAHSPENKAQRPSSSTIRAALKKNNVTIARDLATRGYLDDLANILWFERQLQPPSPRATQSEQAIAEQVNQAVANFKARYQSLAVVTQPRWDTDLSISSPFLTPNQPETTDNDCP